MLGPSLYPDYYYRYLRGFFWLDFASSFPIDYVIAWLQVSSRRVLVHAVPHAVCAHTLCACSSCMHAVCMRMHGMYYHGPTCGVVAGEHNPRLRVRERVRLLSLSLSRSASITGARTATCWSSSQSLVTCAVSLLRSSYFQLTASWGTAWDHEATPPLPATTPSPHPPLPADRLLSAAGQGTEDEPVGVVFTVTSLRVEP